MIAPRLRDEDVIEYQAKNPKEKGTVSRALYRQYMAATTVAEARRCGSRPIDFAFDPNWGYLTVQGKTNARRWTMTSSESGFLLQTAVVMSSESA